MNAVEDLEAARAQLAASTEQLVGLLASPGFGGLPVEVRLDLICGFCQGILLAAMSGPSGPAH